VPNRRSTYASDPVHGVEDEQPDEADADTGENVRREDAGTGEGLAPDLRIERERHEQPEEHRAADGEHGEDRRGGQDDAGGIAGEEPHVVAETDDRGRGRAEGPVERRVVDVHDQRAVREGADQDEVRQRHREEHERIATGAA